MSDLHYLFRIPQFQLPKGSILYRPLSATKFFWGEFTSIQPMAVAGELGECFQIFFTRIAYNIIRQITGPGGCLL